MVGALPVSPLAPANFPDLPVIDGVQFASVAAEVRYTGRRDVMLALLAPGTSVAGVFTRSSTRAAPVLDCQDKLRGADAAEASNGAAILVNAGNANAFTGAHGQASVAEITAAVAQASAVPQSRVFTASTGVIGEKLPHDRILAKLDALVDGLSPDGAAEAARAIMTTDTFPKGACAVVDIDGQPVRISGFAKGSGMIAPDMATMLVYIFTDARIEQAPLQALLARLNEQTFNCITVDSDTSTSDTLMLAATGHSGVAVEGVAAFEETLHRVMLDLAHQVVRDGEGATKFVEFCVRGAQSDAEAKIHARAMADSPLVKTAIAGEDPNWGRIVMAIGKAGERAERDLVSIAVGGVEIARRGQRVEGYDE
ncbi:MAG: bifunctional glutamate N-acetyltransferase/amino-acid acetyltransferase ArgJ, partial [Pseudomonadota bacterium]